MLGTLVVRRSHLTLPSDPLSLERRQREARNICRRDLPRRRSKSGQKCYDKQVLVPVQDCMSVPVQKVTQHLQRGAHGMNPTTAAIESKKKYKFTFN